MSLPRVFLAIRSEYLRERFQGVLEFEGYAVATAGDNTACVPGIKEFVPDVLIIEPDLPEGHVEDVLEAIHADPQLKEIAVVLLAKQTRLESLRETTCCPFCDYLAPPTSYTQLAACVRRVLSQRVGHVSNVP